MTSAFIDTSVAMRFILSEPNVYAGMQTFEHLYASEILRVEALRTIDRLRIQRGWGPDEVVNRIEKLIAFLARVDEIPIQSPILRRAADPFPTIVGTLDAIHIATALLAQDQIGKPLRFLTHDRNQGLAAQAAGLAVDGFR